jgi:hypothetical protein
MEYLGRGAVFVKNLALRFSQWGYNVNYLCGKEANKKLGEKACPR